MIKISALNEESEEESGSEEEVTKEALEQIAIQQYAKALELQRKGNLKEASQLLKSLLDTELLDEVKKPEQSEKTPNPLLQLKYLSYKNLASMLNTSEDVEGAIDAYCSAFELDDTDVTLWFRLGQVCMKGKRYEMALHAFQRGLDRNPRHWPCLDKIVTLLLGLGFKEECISTIHEALQLDPGYLRGLAYRKHIYTDYPYIREYMEYLNPIYKWNEKDDDPFDEKYAAILLKEADEIHECFIEQQKADQFKYVIPQLKLIKPISNLNWQSVGDSLVHMHHYISENFYSHACPLELIFEKEVRVEPMEVCEEPKEVEQIENKVEENNVEPEKNIENGSENENNDLSDKDKAATDTEKVESDIEVVPSDATTETQPELKTPKKPPVRRRGSALSFLEQWEWCTKRRSGRKKPVNKQEQNNIYETLRKLVPTCLIPDTIQKKENHKSRDTSPDTTGIEKLFEDIDKPEDKENKEYFGSEDEQRDVKNFISKYTQNIKDIIDILKDYLNILAVKWGEKWPEGLSEVFIEANKCYMNHIDVPTCTSDNHEDLVHYTTVNILVEEFSVNEKLTSTSEKKEPQKHDLCVIENIGLILNLKPHIFVGTECMELMLRFLWVKLHIHMLNKLNEFALDCYYQLLCEFDVMGEHHDTYTLNVVNFTFKPAINEDEILAGIKFLERNKKLSTVMDLFDNGDYEEVLTIVVDSFEYCKTMSRTEEEDMSLDLAVQMSLILDTYWALNKVEECFKWALTCLHESLKHYFRYTTGSQDYDKWTLTVVKILCSMEHILSTEGLTCLEAVSQKELSQGLEDLIRIIGHQVETNATEMPFGTVIPWIIMHYILQREEDQGRNRVFDKDKLACDEVPNPLLVLFIAHEHLGNRHWCCKSEGKLLYFILDTVVPRLRSPALSKALEQVCQYMEQCVYCLFGHPMRKNKLKYLADHNATAFTLDWKRAQQLYEIFKPPILPALEGKVPGITADTEQLFKRILALIPSESNPTKYLPEIQKFINGTENKLPNIPPLIPYKMKDLYFLLGDYYFKKEEYQWCIKYNMLDVAVNNDRFEAWAAISLAKAANVDNTLNSCQNLYNDREILTPAKSAIRCFKRSLELDPSQCSIWIEYGLFVYHVHSFCSRLLKQASESFSMEDFESLEKQKEDLLNTTQKCFTTVKNDINNSVDSEKSNEELWLNYYMLGKVAEKRNKPPSVFLDHYMKAVKCLRDCDAIYPQKINYNTPAHLCIEVLELHYRIHASILKYIEQHENKPIPASVGKVFSTVIEDWKKGSFAKKSKKDTTMDVEVTVESNPSEAVHAANILKRSISDAGEEESHEAKRLKLESAAAKVRRSASYDTERITNKEPIAQIEKAKETATTAPVEEEKQEVNIKDDKSKSSLSPQQPPTTNGDLNKEQPMETNNPADAKKDTNKKEETSSGTSSSSSSDSSSSGTSSESSSDSSRDSESSKSSDDTKHLAQEEIKKIVSSCLDALEDCTSRFPLHYKALYRLAHYHFYNKMGKDIERCRDMMLSTFISRSGHKLGGLFNEKKGTNLFNNIWKIPVSEVERAGGFAFHMSRSVLLTLEILKEIDDHKTLLEISLLLQRTPEPDKKYLRDSDREELSQQAFSLCVQSLKGQLTKFGQQADLKSNKVERQALNSLMLDIYRAYTKAQKQTSAKHYDKFTNLLVEGYKLITNDPINENMNLVDISIKYCQKLIQKLKNEAIDKTQNTQKKQAAKASVAAEFAKASASVAPVVQPPKPDPPPVVKPVVTQASTSTSIQAGLPKMSSQDISAAFQSCLPLFNDPVLAQQAAALYLSNFNALTSLTTLQNTFQSDIYRQYLTQGYAPYMPPVAKKQKRGPKPGQSRQHSQQSNPLPKAKSFSAPFIPVVTKPQATPSVSTIQKSSSTSMAPSMGTVLQSLPASLSANLSSFSSHSSKPAQAHMSSASTMNAAIHTKPPLPHQQVSPGKTLQEKLAERQKHLPLSKNQDINASISKLPSSLTITKTSVPKPVTKKPEAKKSLPFSERPKPIASDEVIVLDDD